VARLSARVRPSSRTKASGSAVSSEPISQAGDAGWSWRLALAVFAVALVVRGMHLFQIRQAPFSSLLMGDAQSYDAWARRLAAGDWIGRDVFYQAPLYPYFVGVLYAFFNHNPLAVKVCQVLLGSGSCALLGTATAGLFGWRAGLAAGLVLAVYAPAVFFDGLIQKTVLDSFFLCGLLVSIVLLYRRSTPIRALWAGVSLGCLVLTRENSLVFLPLIAVWLWRRDRRGLLTSAAFVGGVTLMLAPVAIRNAVVGGEFHLTTFQAGPNLYIGNSAEATGNYVPLRPDRGTAKFERQDATALAERAVGHPLSASGVSEYWQEQAWAWMSSHPLEWLRLTGKKFLLTWNVVEAADTEDVYTYATWSWPLRLSQAVLPFGVLAPLGLLGIWLTRARWRDLWVVYAMIAAYVASVVLFFVLARYRYPIVPLLTMFAGAAVTAFPAWWRASRPRDRRAAAAVVAGAALLCYWPLQSPAEMQSATRYNIGYALAGEGRIDEAIAEYRVAIEQMPTNAPARSNLGSLLSGRGQHDEALRQLQEATRLDPRLAAARISLGIELAAQGHSQAAMESFRRALELEPDEPRAHYNLGVALASSGDTNEALHHLREAVRLQPAYADAQNNLGVLLSMTGQVPEAIEHFTAALAAQPGNQQIRANLDRARQIAGGK
jgi:tetratricopeptide (TPR) repeat protein